MPKGRGSNARRSRYQKDNQGWYVIEVNEGLTARNHDGGSLVLYANNADHALERAEWWVRTLRPAPGEWAQWTPHRDFDVESVRPLSDQEFNVFPDQGCC